MKTLRDNNVLRNLKYVPTPDPYFPSIFLIADDQSPRKFSLPLWYSFSSDIFCLYEDMFLLICPTSVLSSFLWYRLVALEFIVIFDLNSRLYLRGATTSRSMYLKYIKAYFLYVYNSLFNPHQV